MRKNAQKIRFFLFPCRGGKKFVRLRPGWYFRAERYCTGIFSLIGAFMISHTPTRPTHTLFRLLPGIAALLITQTLRAQPEQPAVPSILTSEHIRILESIDPVNTEGLEYGPSVGSDGTTLYFISNRPGSIPMLSAQPPGAPKYRGNLRPTSEPVEYSHDVWVALKETPYDSTFYRVYNADTTQDFGDLSLNTARNEGVGSISADGNTLFVTLCEHKAGYGSCDIFMSKRTPDGTWGSVINPGAAINTEFWESQPCITPDSRRLYFVSNRPGGVAVPKKRYEMALPEASIDIWYSDYDTVQQRFLPAVHAGTILNTSGKEFSPYMCPDNRTLVFASDGHPSSLGGLDFYYSSQDADGNWSTPVHLDAPLNSDEDEAFLTIAPSGDILYFSSRRTDLSNRGFFDIFMAVDDRSLHRSATLSMQHSAPDMSIRITNSRNEVVRELLPGNTGTAGTTYTVRWDATDSRGFKVPPGNYRYTTVINGKAVEEHTLTLE